MDTLPLFCECNSMACTKQVQVSIEEAQRIETTLNWVIIVDGCHYGPDSTDVFVEQKPGYRIYRES